MLPLLTAALTEADPLPRPQMVLALVVALSMLVIVIELVRRQKLREEYSILWVCTALMLTVLALSTRVLTWLANLLEAQSLVSILYFGALVFLLLVALQFSVRLTKLTYRGKTAGQRIALLEAEVEELKERLQAQLDDGEPRTEIPRPAAGSDPADSDPADIDPQVPAPGAATPRNRVS